MPFVDRDGVKIFYEDTGGNGEVIFMTHGFGSGSKMWDGQLELSKKFRVIRWDMRGHAQSESPDDETKYSKQHQVDDMAAVLDACKVEQAIFLGHSMGAYDNMLFFLSSPQYARRMKALVIFGSGPGFAKAKAREGWNKNADKLAGSYASKGLEALVGSDRDKGHTEHGARVGLAHSAKNVFGQRDYDPLYARMPDGASVAATHLKDLRLPVLIIIGDRDKQFRASSEMMKAKIPSAQMILVAEAGHMANEKQPALFNEHVARFAGSLPRAGASKL
uniref:AB hydrolase-1 domain-containing protein n=1 Tax=Alexandrium catenella TaxID=2925 RepID=A0A7S1S676_ALECA|mmetsp:Transcript_87997/g.233594  ORF Transcript_87997/g.233594 Transcript_87997/m.233594 type:complete len:276 (+) Transcript_87997:1-828(+)